MTIRITSPGKICSSIRLPASKSISNRALLINALGRGDSQIENIADCDDTRVMAKALSENREIIDSKAAGTAMRFLTAYYSITAGKHILTGTGRMKQRPVAILTEALKQLGADISYMEKEGFPPLQINGKKLSGNVLTLKGNVSSQYISALMMIAPLLEGGLTLHLTEKIISRPYIDLTLKLMKVFGAAGEWQSLDRIQIYPQPYQTIHFKVENDWSAASYWYEIASLCNVAQIELTGLYGESMQGDSKVKDLFKQLGVETFFTDSGIKLQKTSCKTKKLEYDFTDQPDLAQTLAVTCAMKGIPFRFSGLHSLRIKETDRIGALVNELGKLGVSVTVDQDATIFWDGKKKEMMQDVAIETYDDHRMAMAFAPVCLILPEIRINDPEVVSKSYPKFWNDLSLAGFVIQQELATE